MSPGSRPSQPLPAPNHSKSPTAVRIRPLTTSILPSSFIVAQAMIFQPPPSICLLRDSDTVEPQKPPCYAECHSAIQQIENLRYEEFCRASTRGFPRVDGTSGD